MFFEFFMMTSIKLENIRIINYDNSKSKDSYQFNFIFQRNEIS